MKQYLHIVLKSKMEKVVFLDLSYQYDLSYVTYKNNWKHSVNLTEKLWSLKYSYNYLHLQGETFCLGWWISKSSIAQVHRPTTWAFFYVGKDVRIKYVSSDFCLHFYHME